MWSHLFAQPLIYARIMYAETLPSKMVIFTRNKELKGAQCKYNHGRSCHERWDRIALLLGNCKGHHNTPLDVSYQRLKKTFVIQHVRQIINNARLLPTSL
ncbi:hypothetical protein OUZ56_010785 [Daphnia magna]|uniref:Uncharacterized protein n=1 Tax=Daphnia magna TaxID=35525 RepID=A0ABQ9YZR2_9CRUS|nr:hypothetical protein OUZ56_010785 [Daphnia magna]